MDYGRSYALMAVVMALQYGTYYSGQNQRSVSNANKFLVIGVIVAVLLGAALLAANLFSGSSKNDVTLLAARETSLYQLASTSKPTITNPDLATANTNATILSLSDVQALTTATGAKTLPTNIVKQEADTNGPKLKQAQILNNFDPTYQQVVLAKVSALITEAQTVSHEFGTGSTTYAAISQTIANLQSISKQFTQLQLQ